MLNPLRNLSGQGDTTNPSSAQKNVTKPWMVSLSHSFIACIGATTVTQFRITVSTTTLKNVGDKGSPWVTPMYS